ncbi:serine protease [Candidatus Methylacidiphilum infernorum]|uniref:Serine protease n=1 Tax=Candidatus Methylacidiphilum infernorum TaxID=511746 RepID=A0ABX7PSU3_9BACT|nr:NfeD family protein [Candidatus Methylacidiphilum infernorum]QSR86044.1 serine protease [Candidatus Methylacidiphilum infernorum]
MKTLLCLLIFLGSTVLFIELLFPSYIMAFLGSSLLAGALAMGFIFYGPGGAVVVIGAELLLLLVALGIGIKIFPRTQLKKKMQLEETNREQTAFDINQFVGKEGRCESPCKPEGYVRVMSKRLEAVSETGYIEEGLRIKVVGTKEGKAIVRAIRNG